MLEIILVVLALIAIVGACIYFYVDMKDHKATNNTDFEKINKNIESEQTTRLGNIKYVVDQVNTKNAAIDKEYTDKLDLLGKTDTGFGTLIAAENLGGSNISMKDVTVDNTSKIKLMKDVSVIGSMSIKDLEIANRTSTSTKASFKACGAGTGSDMKCIQFPNSEGDTYLTALSTGKNVVSGSVFKANEGILTDTITNLSTTNPLTIKTKDSLGAVVNTITVGKVLTDGITLESGTSRVEIKNGIININTGTTPSITLNGNPISVTTLTTNNTLGLKVLTLP